MYPKTMLGNDPTGNTCGGCGTRKFPVIIAEGKSFVEALCMECAAHMALSLAQRIADAQAQRGDLVPPTPWVGILLARNAMLHAVIAMYDDARREESSADVPLAYLDEHLAAPSKQWADAVALFPPLNAPSTAPDATPDHVPYCGEPEISR